MKLGHGLVVELKQQKSKALRLYGFTHKTESITIDWIVSRDEASCDLTRDKLGICTLINGLMVPTIFH